MKHLRLISHIPRWEKQISWVLEFVILAAGIFQLFFGTVVIGGLILISLAIILYPKFFTRSYIQKFPLEIEILLFLMVILQFVVGETMGFYTNVPLYDKFIHYILPLFVGLTAFLIFFTMHETGRVKCGTGIAILFIILITVGIGAVWEIIEYCHDMVIYPLNQWHHFQGNALENGLQDTMHDLMVDFVGGIFGSLLGLWFLEKSRFKKSKRVDELTKEIAADLFANKTIH
ncbi:MAG: hypothetical protein KBD46_02990 [Candidatus Levybacteria bacterium]|nr:hypothetical protein [Candidatus Levybacteria bacterium]